MALIDRFPKYQTIEVIKTAIGSNVVKILDYYIHTHGVPQSIRLYQARCQIGYNIKKNFSKFVNIKLIAATVN